MALELLNDSEGRLLPPKHPTALRVQRVVQRILDGNGLGVAEVAHASPRGLGAALETTGEGIEDAGEGKAAGGQKRWMIWVVDKPQEVNAAVAFGASSPRSCYPTGLLRTHELSADQIIPFTPHRKHYRFHGYSLRCQRRQWSSCRPLTRFV